MFVSLSILLIYDLAEIPIDKGDIKLDNVVLYHLPFISIKREILYNIFYIEPKSART